MQPHRRQPTRLPRPWDSPGKNTGVGCHFLLQCMEVKRESEVAQSCPTLRHSMDCSPPGSSVHVILQARVLEWGAIAFSAKYPHKPKNFYKVFFDFKHASELLILVFHVSKSILILFFIPDILCLTGALLEPTPHEPANRVPGLPCMTPRLIWQQSVLWSGFDL